jgi:predicted transcriptional regulator
MRRATVYFDDNLHKALRIKAMESDRTISDLVNDAIRLALEEDQEDLAAIRKRRNQVPISYESFLKELKSRGQI